MDEQVLFIIMNKFIERANELHNTSNSKETTPVVAGRAAWERNGILYALETICEETGVCDFKSLFENIV